MFKLKSYSAHPVSTEADFEQVEFPSKHSSHVSPFSLQCTTATEASYKNIDSKN